MMPISLACCQFRAKSGSMYVIPSVALIKAKEILPLSAAQSNDGPCAFDTSMPLASATALLPAHHRLQDATWPPPCPAPLASCPAAPSCGPFLSLCPCSKGRRAFGDLLQ